MRIGISVSSSHATGDPREGARHMVERARAARAAGLDTLFVGDHHATPFPYYQNTPMLGRMLAEWDEKPFGALYLLPLWHPVLVAEQVATLAALASGRFILQCGLGDARQGRAMGVGMSQRAAKLEASLAVLRALWRGESVDEPRFWQLSRVRIAPLPAAPVAVWIGAVAPQAIRRAARLGDGWLGAPSLTAKQADEAARLYRAACEELGRAPGVVALRRDVYVGATSQEARAVVEPYVAAGYRGIASEALLFGSTAEVADQIGALRELGYTDVCVRNISSRQPEALATIERLARVKALLAA